MLFRHLRFYRWERAVFLLQNAVCSGSILCETMPIADGLLITYDLIVEAFFENAPTSNRRQRRNFIA